MTTVAAGLDVGGTKTLCVVIDATGTVLAEAEAPSPTDGSREALEALGGLVAGVLANAGADPSEATLGVGLAGMVAHGRLVVSPHLPHLVGSDVEGVLEGALGVRVRGVNDADAALAAEWAWGSARGARDVAMVTLGTGIGGSFVLDGRPVAGRGGFAGEIGHMVVVPGGEACPCGGRGCWERYASGEALARYARAALDEGRLELGDGAGEPGHALGPSLVAAARAGTPGAAAVLDELAHWLALGLANLVVALDLERVVLGGGLGAEADLYAPTVLEDLGARLEGAAARGPLALGPAAYGTRAGAVGAARLGTRP
ncbi:MAG TPA: ROK family protein [Acidimicrobiales bacterium]|nr:ROK family protein [Acidimicrobiales bacterium]